MTHEPGCKRDSDDGVGRVGRATGRARRSAIAVTALLLLVAPPARALDGTDARITFAQEAEEQGRRQLRRILSVYDLDPWIFTRDVRVKAGVQPHSKPILTLNTNYLDDDEKQLSLFLHEQAHWLPATKREAAVRDLRERYGDIPGVPAQGRNYAGTEEATFHHLIVAWVELDAMTELVGEAKARRIMEEKVQEFVEEPLSDADRSFMWYTERVLEDTQAIGAILATHDLVITSGKGLVVGTRAN